MADLIWLKKQTLLRLHEISLSEHGGSPGLRDDGLLDSALARPQNLAAYERPDVADLAAAYGFGLAKNHPFIDGNKRAAFLAIGVFLDLNGFDLVVDQADAVETILSLAAGDLTEADLAAWIRAHARSAE